MADKKRMTTNFGKPVGDDLNSLTAGSPGYTLLSDVHLHDKMAHFNRERIPERVVHAKSDVSIGGTGSGPRRVR